ncbi:MAG: fused MFS/spermidine synthase, partial [Candidatus Pacebacteria bacterium]|nr:fused MFS/spermidine synthase [Candidatus Paceibacterota bacterium]
TDTTRINNYVQDGRVFLHETTAQYDVIFEDAFGSAMSLPVHLVTKEFYELVRSRLAPEGILMVNYVGVLRGVGTPSVTGSTIQTIRSVFPNTKVYALNKDNPYDIQNIMIIARNGDTDIDFAETTLTGRYLQEERIADMEIAPYYFALEDEIVFTDDQAPLEYLWLMQ